MNQVRDYLERPKLYYNIDGVGELGIGFMYLTYALFAWLEARAPENSFLNRPYGFLVYMTAMVSIIHYGSKAIKERITYRRTGFVEYTARDKYWIPFALGAGISALLSVGIALAMRRHWQASTLVSLLVGLALTAGYIRIARTVRWKWAVFIVMLAGAFMIAALPADVTEAFANHTDLTRAIPARTLGACWLTFVVFGVVMMISGGISFWLYLRHTEAPEVEDE